jgi:16S rRNA (adenine1518-N6/adenine1519-N6)-dimethyltransferase
MTLTEIKNVLAVRGLAPNKRLGQNFLFDQNLCHWLAAQAALAPGEVTWEIGPGLGCYTEALLATGAFVHAIEIDRGYSAWLRERFGADEKFVLVEGDALEEMGRCDGVRTVTGNLPYNISTPLIMALLSLPRPPQVMAFVLQYEMARRIAAVPGQPDYSAVSVAVQGAYRVELLRKIPPTVFHPRPAVESAALRLTRRADAVPDAAVFTTFVRRAFAGKRKQLLNTLAATPGERRHWQALLEAQGLPPTIRAEAIPVETWRLLHGAL